MKNSRACWCDECKKRHIKVDNDAINMVQEETVVNLCNTYVVENTLRGEQVMILDLGAPMSLVGRPWLEKYFAEMNYKIEELVSYECHQVFIFRGIDKRHITNKMIELPLLI